MSDKFEIVYRAWGNVELLRKDTSVARGMVVVEQLSKEELLEAYKLLEETFEHHLSGTYSSC